jgi:hypothetical protein
MVVAVSSFFPLAPAAIVLRLSCLSSQLLCWRRGGILTASASSLSALCWLRLLALRACLATCSGSCLRLGKRRHSRVAASAHRASQLLGLAHRSSWALSAELSMRAQRAGLSRSYHSPIRHPGVGIEEMCMFSCESTCTIRDSPEISDPKLAQWLPPQRANRKICDRVQLYPHIRRYA